RGVLADAAWGALDVLLLDLPPGTDRLVTVASLLPTLSGTIVVTIPSDVAHLVVRKSITIAAQAKAPVLGLVENMAGLFPGPSGVDLAREAGIPFLGAVPFDPALSALRLDLLREPGARRGGGDRPPRARAADTPRTAAVRGDVGRAGRVSRRRRDAGAGAAPRAAGGDRRRRAARALRRLRHRPL